VNDEDPCDEEGGVEEDEPHPLVLVFDPTPNCGIAIHSRGKEKT
jgi:hypothetical protein